MNSSFMSAIGPMPTATEAVRSLCPFESATCSRFLERMDILSTQIGVAGVLLGYIIWLSNSSAPVVSKAPVAGFRNSLEPSFLLRLRFVFDAVKIMNDGYYKFKDMCYVVKRMDTDVTIVPSKYFSELRKSGHDELDSTDANIHNILGKYTSLNEMRFNDQFIKVLTQCLNPNLNNFMEIVQDELDHSFRFDMADIEGSAPTAINVHTRMKRIISRVTSRLVLGLPYCRDKTMLWITEQHTLCIFSVALTLRRFPPFLHPLVALLIPYRWQIWRNIHDTKKVTRQILEQRATTKAQGDSLYTETLLEWMIDNATPAQKDLSALVLTQLAVTTAAIFTVSQVTSNLLVYLAESPEYIDELRQEILHTMDDNKRVNPSNLRKMEACVVETLRLSPPLTNAPQRRAMSDLTLKDGVVIPKGAMIAFPCIQSATDPSIYPDPMEFRPFRKENFTTPATTSSKSRLAFGWGAQACPGRFFAVREVKIVVARLLMDFDIEAPPGLSKLKRSWDIEDFRILNPNVRLSMRRRAVTPRS